MNIDQMSNQELVKKIRQYSSYLTGDLDDSASNEYDYVQTLSQLLDAYNERVVAEM